uniref:Uncharacterized protein n=1 Tax=Rhizophora mucronata TaxID=61149 RepID=A0A2P2QS61_RHIMU
MDSLVHSATTNFGRGLNGYEHLDQNDELGMENHPPKSFSKNRNEPDALVISLSQRRKRAKQRQIYLKSYKLASRNKLRRSKCARLNKAAIKVRSVVVSLVSIIRIGALRSCNARSAISASPMRITKFC